MFSIIYGGYLLALSSTVATLMFVFLYFYYKDKSKKKFINLFSISLAVLTILITVRLFSEKGLF